MKCFHDYNGTLINNNNYSSDNLNKNIICFFFYCRCIKEAFKESKLCPTCRKKLTTKQIHPIYFS